MNVIVEFYNPWNAKLHRTVAQVCYEPTACDSATSSSATSTQPTALPPPSPSPLTSLTGMPISDGAP